MTHETVPLNRRIYMVMQPSADGMAQFRLSAMPPHYDEPVAVLLVRGVLPAGNDVVMQVVSDPAASPDLRGKDGADGKNGIDGKAGADGPSAYDTARSLGYGGTKTQWMTTLNGAAGKDGANGAAGKDGTNGTDGKNASAILGTVNMSQTATVAISAGTRRMVVTIPASWGIIAGDPLVALPSAALAGYAVHDVVAVSPTSLSIGLTAPLLAIGASFSIPCRIARLNT
jgi:hypothetical protein